MGKGWAYIFLFCFFLNLPKIAFSGSHAASKSQIQNLQVFFFVFGGWGHKQLYNKEKRQTVAVFLTKVVTITDKWVVYAPGLWNPSVPIFSASLQPSWFYFEIYESNFINIQVLKFCRESIINYKYLLNMDSQVWSSIFHGNMFITIMCWGSYWFSMKYIYPLIFFQHTLPCSKYHAK